MKKNNIMYSGLLLFSGLLFSKPVRTPFSYKTITQFQQKIVKLSENPSLKFKSMQKEMKHYQKTILSAQEWTSTLSQCIELLQEQYKKRSWLNNRLLNFSKPSTPFQLFIKKLMVPQDTTIALWGDLHGSIHSLLRSLQYLISKGFLCDDFTISRPDFYMVFLGDYVDRGKYGIEVWYTLARLKIANPEQVIILRGNHEDADLNYSYGFVLECTNKFKDADQRNYALSTLFNLYTLLPAALFLSSHPENEYIQCCHGGLEVGFDPKEFLKSKAQYCLIQEVNREDIIKTINYQPFSQLIRSNHCFSKFISPLHTIKKTGDSGFMWNDFLVNSTGIAQCNPGRSIAFGKDITHAFLNFCSTPVHKVVGVIRAHQHNNASGGNMLDQLRTQHGLVDLWEEPRTVTTLCSAPDAQGLNFNDDSFLLMTTKKEYKNWKFNHVHTPIKRS